MQEEFVEPAPPAFARVDAARAGDVLKQNRRAVMAVGVDFLGQRARQRLFGARAGLQQLSRH